MIAMEGITISEMAEMLKIPRDTVQRRLLRAGRKPFTMEALYTAEDFEAIKNTPPPGRPRKPKDTDAESVIDNP